MNCRRNHNRYDRADRPSAEVYLAMHTARLKGFGVPQVNGKIFDVNAELSAIDRAPL